MTVIFLFTGLSAADAARIHRAGPGENLGLIAARYDTDVAELLRLNPFMEDPDRVIPGQVLVVPGVVAPPPDNRPGDSPKHEVKTAPPASPPPTITQVRRQYPAHFLTAGPRDLKRVALTFDDGPEARYTPAVLDILKEHRILATFFLIGRQIDRHPGVVQRIHAEGHVIGSHSWSHAKLNDLTAGEALSEIHRTEKAVFDLTGRLPALFRCPYGDINETAMQLLIASGYKNIFWTADSLDWDVKDPDRVLINTLTDTGRGTIILMHSGGGRDQNLDAGMAALPDLIYTLQAQGYEFVTVDGLLSVPAYRN